MKIVIPGHREDVLERAIRDVKRFQCLACGCVFDADDTEYEKMYDGYYFACKCPCCEGTCTIMRGGSPYEYKP